MEINPGWDPTSEPTFWINQASRAILRGFARELRPLGFGTAYWPVALALDEAGPMRQTDLLDRMDIEQPTLTALLARMERDGIIARQPDPDDGRAKRVALTEDGKARIQDVKAAMLGVAGRAIAGLTEDEGATLIAALRKIVAALA